MDDDWEQLVDNVVIPPKTPNLNKWEGEDEDEEVKESWEDEEEKKDEEKIETKPMTNIKVKPKKSLQEKINEREQKRIEMEELENERRNNMTPEEALAEKLRLQKIQEEEDLKAAMDTFGVIPEKASGIDSMQPTTKAEFSELATEINKKISQYKTSEEFPGFIEELIRNVCANLCAADIRKIKLTVENVHLEKQRMEKEKTKKPPGKGKTKIRLRVEEENVKSNNIDDYGYDYDYDDFM